jgi:hypothetical protein
MMSQSTTYFTPVPDPAPLPVIVSSGAVERLSELFTAEQLDAAMDRAAQCSKATVAVFAAAPIDCWADQDSASGAVAIEFVVEFFVPPASQELFHRELEAQLLLASPRYVAGRYRGDFGPCGLHSISFGTFHQYRITCRASAADQRESRWCRDRLFVDGILHQARTGWRELGETHYGLPQPSLPPPGAI